MKFFSRRAAAVTLAVIFCVSLTPAAGALSVDRERNRDTTVATKFLKKLHKLFGIAVNDDLPLPPPPAPPPPPTNP